MSSWIHFDAFSGIAGDMALGALIDVGVPVDVVRNAIAAVGLEPDLLTVHTRTVQGLSATDIQIRKERDPPHRHYPDIVARIEAATLTAGAKARALAIFEALAIAEAAVHGRTIEKVHFHEVGAADSIADIVGTAAALDHLQPERITCSALPISPGFVDCAHGRMPLPAPATAKLIKGIPTLAADNGAEMVTPTGAAIVKASVDAFLAWPEMTIQAEGYGAGDRVLEDRPNLLRVLLGERSAAATDSVIELCANIDDMTGEDCGHLLGRLMEAGALDAWFTPIFMKKNRPAVTVSALVAPEDQASLRQVFFAHSTTLGLRSRRLERTCLPREQRIVDTKFGPISLKISGQKVSAEYEDCAAAAKAHGVTIFEIRQAALRAWEYPTASDRLEGAGEEA